MQQVPVMQQQPPPQQLRGEVVKLFVGQIPKTLEEDGVREVFQEFGEIVEIVILRDRRTNLHQGCCFVKYNSLIAAQSAINTLHNQRSLPPLRNPLQVRFADSGVNSADRGQTNAENKLFVGGVPSGCGDKELRALFNTYGEVLDVYILASKASQEGQRGCAFVRYAAPQSCAMAIEALHGKYAMKAGELPLVVRYADPPKSQRGGGQCGGSGGNVRFPWQGQPPIWPSGPPPPGWPMPWGMTGGAVGMPSPYPPWMMPGSMQGGPPGGMPPYGYGYGQYGQGGSQHGSQGPGGPQANTSPTGYAGIPPPPPPPSQGGGDGQPPLPPPTPAPASAWSEHLTSEGLKYYYNTATGTSAWEEPAELSRARAGGNGAPPLPPLPSAVGAPAAAGLEQAIGQLSMAPPAGVAYPPGPAAMPPSSSFPASTNGLGLPSLGGLGQMPLDSAVGLGGLGALPSANGAVAAAGSTILIQEWPGQAPDLRQAFAQFGQITFCELDTSTTSARISFDAAVSASHAVDVMHGLAVGEKKLHVSSLPY